MLIINYKWHGYITGADPGGGGFGGQDPKVNKQGKCNRENATQFNI